MGYTHYFSIENDLSPEAWGGVINDAKAIVALAIRQGVGLAGGAGHLAPKISRQRMLINGSRGQSAGDFDVSPKVMSDFCKTGRMPYDSVVVAILLALKSRSMESVHLSTDGEPDEWKEGLLLAAEALQRPLPFSRVKKFNTGSKNDSSSNAYKSHIIQQDVAQAVGHPEWMWQGRQEQKSQSFSEIQMEVKEACSEATRELLKGQEPCLVYEALEQRCPHYDSSCNPYETFHGRQWKWEDVQDEGVKQAIQAFGDALAQKALNAPLGGTQATNLHVCRWADGSYTAAPLAIPRRLQDIFELKKLKGLTPTRLDTKEQQAGWSAMLTGWVEADNLDAVKQTLGRWDFATCKAVLGLGCPTMSLLAQAQSPKMVSLLLEAGAPAEGHEPGILDWYACDAWLEKQPEATEKMLKILRNSVSASEDLQQRTIAFGAVLQAKKPSIFPAVDLLYENHFEKWKHPEKLRHHLSAAFARIQGAVTTPTERFRILDELEAFNSKSVSSIPPRTSAYWQTYHFLDSTVARMGATPPDLKWKTPFFRHYLAGLTDLALRQKISADLIYGEGHIPHSGNRQSPTWLLRLTILRQMAAHPETYIHYVSGPIYKAPEVCPKLNSDDYRATLVALAQVCTRTVDYYRTDDPGQSTQSLVKYLVRPELIENEAPAFFYKCLSDLLSLSSGMSPAGWQDFRQICGDMFDPLLQTLPDEDSTLITQKLLQTVPAPDEPEEAGFDLPRL